MVLLEGVRAESRRSAVTRLPRHPGPPQTLEHTLFLIARSRSRTDVPLYVRNLLRSVGRKLLGKAAPSRLPSATRTHPGPSPASTCLQRHGDVRVPVAPDHREAPRLQCHHQGPLLRLLLQPVTDILGPHRAPEPCDQFQRPQSQQCPMAWGSKSANASWFRVRIEAP